MGLTNSFWYRGYDPRLPQTVIVAGFDLDEGSKLSGSCFVATRNTNPFGVENEESRDHPDILLCRNLRMPWSVSWEHYRCLGGGTPARRAKILTPLGITRKLAM